MKYKDLALMALIIAVFIGTHAAVDALDRHDARKAEDLKPVYVVEISEPVDVIELPPLPEETPEAVAEATPSVPPYSEAELAMLAACSQKYRDDVPLTYEEQEALYGACLEFEIEYPVALAMLEQETQFKNTKGDGGNAYGYFQVWPYWHKDRMAELGVTDLMEPEGNFRVAMHFMRELLDRYGNLEDALCYYNSGEPGGNKYSRCVLASVEKWR